MPSSSKILGSLQTAHNLISKIKPSLSPLPLPQQTVSTQHPQSLTASPHSAAAAAAIPQSSVLAATTLIPLLPLLVPLVAAVAAMTKGWVQRVQQDDEEEETTRLNRTASASMKIGKRVWRKWTRRSSDAYFLGAIN
uniref:Uncharacterized protein n=2 Tax=Setaria italica TaxID=4555 RepID=K3ZK89_SETIT